MCGCLALALYSGVVARRCRRRLAPFGARKMLTNIITYNCLTTGQSLKHSSNNYWEHIAPLKGQCCTGVVHWSSPVRRWNRNAAQEWGAGTHQWSAGTSMVHRSGAREPTSGAREPQCCTGVGRGNPHPVWSFKSIKRNGVGRGTTCVVAWL